MTAAELVGAHSFTFSNTIDYPTATDGCIVPVVDPPVVSGSVTFDLTISITLAPA